MLFFNGKFYFEKIFVRGLLKRFAEILVFFNVFFELKKLFLKFFAQGDQLELSILGLNYDFFL